MNECCGAPYSYDYINAYNSVVTPSTTHVRCTEIHKFFSKYLLQRAISVFKWVVPSEWSKDYFLYCLYCWGWVAVFNTDKFGVIPQGCGLRGYDVFYRPTTAVISNPLFTGLRELRIGKQCELIRLQPDYGNIMDIVYYYADQLSLCVEAVDMSLINSHIAFLFGAGNKASAESFKKMYDKIASGEPAVFYDKNLLNDSGELTMQMFSQNVGQNYIADKVLSDMRKIIAMFDSEIGIPNANTDKKERLVTNEVDANNVETFSRSDMWLEQLKECCEKVNKMFGLKISVDWRVKHECDTKSVSDSELR